jgi:nucleoside 2-deoxyribosyltransferase
MNEKLSVVGGVYRERCRLPSNTDDTWGSGGRAAAVIAGLGIDTTLYTAVDKTTTRLLASLAYSFHFQTVELEVEDTRQFQYDHALSSPIIWPPVVSPPRLHIEVEAESALVFGMLEATTAVRAKQVVYDPQDPRSPEPFSVGVGTQPRVAYVLNSFEASKLARTEDPLESARVIAERFGAEVVVIKRGPWGALVYEGGRHDRIPAYKTQAVWPIGSGDVFAAVFAAGWACEKLPAAEAAALASRATALYVNNRVLPISRDEIEEQAGFLFEPLVLADTELGPGDYHVYLAAPFFNISQRWLVEEARVALQGMRLTVFSPFHDIGMGGAHDVAPKDIEAIKHSRAILALLDGLDAGTIFEVGYATCLNKPIVVLTESTPEEPLKMISGTECVVVSDFVTALYRVAWAAQR